MKLIDIAVNLTDPMFTGMYRSKQIHLNDFEKVLKRASQMGILITGTDLHSTRDAIELAKKYGLQDGQLYSEGYIIYDLYTTAGFHPTRANDASAGWEDLSKLINSAKSNRIIAVGECGLDYDRLQFSTKEMQLKEFERHFELTEKSGLPMFLHSRAAHADFMDIVRRNRSRFTTGVVHSFDGNVGAVKDIIDMDLYIGLNGCSMKTKENIETIKSIPLDRIMLETDAPYCEIRPTHASHPFIKTTFKQFKKEKFVDGEMVKSRNEPGTLVQVLECVAGIKEIDVAELKEIVYGNTIKVFPLLA